MASNKVFRLHLATPDPVKVSAGFINRYPDRFLFGTDEVASKSQKQYLKAYYQYDPLWKALSEETRAKVLKGNYERLFDRARQQVRA